MRKQAMAGTQVDDAPAAKEPPRPPRHLPCLVQLLARQTASAADSTGQAMKEGVVGKPIEIAIGQAPA